MASRLRDRSRFGGSSVYQVAKNAAIAAARRNNASLWFAGAPADLAGFVWEDSAGTIPATGTAVVGRLTDRAGSNAATQGATAAKPTLELQANGFYGMRLDGSNDFLIASPTSATTNGTVIISATATNLAVFPVLLGQSAGGLQILLNANGAITVSKIGAGMDITTPSGVVQNGMPFVCAVQLNAGGTTAVRINGVTVQTGAQISSSLTPSDIAIGFNGASGGHIQGLMFCVSYCASAYAAQDLATQERFAALLSGATYA